MKHIKALDSLRAFAVFAVIAHHWSGHFESTPTTSLLKTLFVPNAGFGVDLFFVLSGFLITQILLNARSNNTSDGRMHLIKNFVVRRTLRIFPVYFLLIFVLYGLSFSQTRTYLVYYLTYTSNILMYVKHSWCGGLAHTWSLAVEEQFYLFWPWLVVFLPSKYMRYLFPVTVVVGLVSTYFFYHLSPIVSDADPVKSSILMPACLGAFGMGGMLAYLRLFERDKLALFIKAVNILTPVALVFYYLNAFDFLPTIQWRFIDGIISLWLINYALTPKKNFFYRNILENRALIFIGKISYGIYLFHNILPVYYFTTIPLKMRIITHSERVYGFFSNHYVAFGIMFVILIIGSWLSFELFEKQVMRLKDRFNYNS